MNRIVRFRSQAGDPHGSRGGEHARGLPGTRTSRADRGCLRLVRLGSMGLAHYCDQFTAVSILHNENRGFFQRRACTLAGNDVEAAGQQRCFIVSAIRLNVTRQRPQDRNQGRALFLLLRGCRPAAVYLQCHRRSHIVGGGLQLRQLRGWVRERFVAGQPFKNCARGSHQFLIGKRSESYYTSDVGHGFFLLSLCLLIVDKNITGASPMISSATDVTCSVVKKVASEADVAVTASDKVMFIVRMNARLPDGTSFASNLTTFKSNLTTFETNLTTFE